jgi:hypothetical protein
VHAAFLAVVALPGARLSETALELVRDASPTGLAFVPRAHVEWTDEAGTIAVGAWQERSSSGGTRWHRDAGSFTSAVGELRFRRRPWPSEASWSSELAAAVRRVPLADVAEGLAGTFAAINVRADGSGSIVADPAGFRNVYYGASEQEFVASTRAELVATVLALGTQPPRDDVRVAWAAFNSYAIGHRSGFAAVRLLPAAKIIEFRSGLEPMVRPARSGWIPTPSDRAQGLEHHIGVVREELAEGLHAAASLPVEERIVGLTGGKDSRVVLAVILAEGLQDAFVFETTGAEDLPDVVIASELARRFDLRHRVAFPWPEHTQPYGERIRDFVRATAGMANIWDLREIGPHDDPLRIVGLVGEMFRDFVHDWPRAASENELADMFLERSHFGVLNLVVPDVAAVCRADAVAELLRDPGGDLAPTDRMQAFFLRNRVASARFGVLEEIGRQRRMSPYYTIDAIRAALAVGADERAKERLHFEIIRRAADDLARLPFVGAGWSPALLATVPNGDDYSPPELVREAVPVPSKRRPASLMARALTDSAGAHEEAFRDIVSDATNPAWEVIDRARTTAALERLGELRVAQRRALYGALTACLWLRQTRAQA